MISGSVLPALISLRISRLRSSARSARESASVSFWQTRQRNCSVNALIRVSICGSSLGCASPAIAGAGASENRIAKIQAMRFMFDNIQLTNVVRASLLGGNELRGPRVTYLIDLPAVESRLSRHRA